MSGLVYLCLPGLLATPMDLGAQAKNCFLSKLQGVQNSGFLWVPTASCAPPHDVTFISCGMGSGEVLHPDQLSLPQGLEFSCQHPKLGSMAGSEKKPEEALSTHSGTVALTQAFLFSFPINCIECCFLCPELSMKK